MFFGIKSDSMGKDFRQYKHVRTLSRELNNKILQFIPQRDFMAAEKKLGLSRNRHFLPITEEELGIVADYCLYNIYRGGINHVQRYMQTASVSEAELSLLEAMAMAWYSVFQILEVGSGYIILRDFITTKEYRVMDKNLAQSGIVGLMLSVRLIPCGGWYMTTGGGIAITSKTLDDISPILAKFDRQHPNEDSGIPFSPAREAIFSAQISRVLLRANTLEQMRHQD